MAASIKTAFQLAAGLIGQFNGQDAPLIQQAAGQIFDVACFNLAG
jgi:hypothetical protein